MPEPRAASAAVLDDVLRRFVARSRFSDCGGVVTDLDGTAVHELDGRVAVPMQVVEGLKALRMRGRPLVLNTLRFPLSVIDTFGRAWYDISQANVPLVSMNGSQIGYLEETSDGAIGFEEIAAFPLEAAAIHAAVRSLRAMIADGIDDVLLFFYPRDWRRGEIIWTPDAARIPHLEAKYASAAKVVALPLEALCDELLAGDVCMIFLLLDAPADRLMAYQHSSPASFITAEGTSKLSGARTAAKLVGFDLDQSLGAGDTPMDGFLDGVGLAVLVGDMKLDFRGRMETVRVGTSLELGDLLFRLAALTEPA